MLSHNLSILNGGSAKGGVLGPCDTNVSGTTGDYVDGVTLAVVG